MSPSALDAAIAALAGRQRGLVTSAQLEEAGVQLEATKYRVRVGYLRPVHRGVYQVGPVDAPLWRETAALLACGPESVLSHGTAGALWEILPPLVPSARVEVTVPRGLRRRRAGILEHRTGGFGDGEVREVDGLRVTAPARTILDLAGLLPTRELERMVARAQREERIDPGELAALLARYPTRRGPARLRAILDGGRDPALTRSEAEERFLDLVRRARLPRPDANARLGAYEVDFLWRAERVVVEVDGFAFHASRRGFESDRRRDADLAALGVQVLRVTWRQIVREPEVALVRLAQTLALRRGPQDGREDGALPPLSPALRITQSGGPEGLENVRRREEGFPTR